MASKQHESTGSWWGIPTVVALGLGGVAVMFALLSWGTVRASTRSCMPWERINLEVRSEPAGAEVFVDGRRIGRAPTGSVQVCGGKRSHVRAHLPGRVNWEWTGILPNRGRLSLTARPMPR